MKPVYQTVFGNKKGNCFAACFASIFEISLDDVPNFVSNERDDWWDDVDAWCLERGYYPLPLDVQASKESGWYLPKGYQIITGKSPRGDWAHAVVALDGKIIHDPHPSGDGLVDQKECLVFVALEPRVI